MTDGTSQDAQTQAWMEARTRSKFSGDPQVPTVADLTPGVTAAATGHELVVDLPEGQKVILGRLPLGTVVEIASWRGTGGPDSRTSRLLLGTGSAVSSADSRAASTSPAATRTASPSRRAPRAADSTKARTTRMSRAATITAIALGALATGALGFVILTAILT